MDNWKIQDIVCGESGHTAMLGMSIKYLKMPNLSVEFCDMFHFSNPKNGFIVYFKEGNFLYCFVCCLPAGKGSVPDMRKYLHT